MSNKLKSVALLTVVAAGILYITYNINKCLYNYDELDFEDYDDDFDNDIKDDVSTDDDRDE